jgi:hypothetical protein
MSRWVGRRPSPALVVALIALFVALGGSGYAAVKINGSQIEDRSIDGNKIKRDTVTGTEVRESKLKNIVASGAATEGTVRRFAYAGPAPRNILFFRGISINASCTNGDLEVRVRSISPFRPGQLQTASTSTTATGATAFNERVRAFTDGGAIDILPARDNNQLGHTEIFRSGEDPVSLLWQADNPSLQLVPNAPAVRCLFRGNAIFGGTG